MTCQVEIPFFISFKILSSNSTSRVAFISLFFIIPLPCGVYLGPFVILSKLDLSIIFKKPNLDGVHLGDVKMTNGNWQIAGESGYVLVVTGTGTTVEECRKQAYGRIENILLQNMFYRTDIGVGWGEDSDKLQTWGYLY